MNKRFTATLENVCNQILKIPSVEGMVLCSLGLDTLYTRFKTTTYKESHLTEFLRGLTNLLRMSVQLNMACQVVECRFKDSLVLSYPIGSQYKMSIFFHANANKRIIKMVALSHLSAIQEALLLPDAVLQRSRSGSFSAGSFQKVTIKPSLQPRLDIIMNALQAALSDDDGKKSLLVMEEGIKKWASLGPVNKKELPVLADILCKSIADPVKMKQFLCDIEDTFLGIR